MDKSSNHFYSNFLISSEYACTEPHVKSQLSLRLRYGAGSFWRRNLENDPGLTSQCQRISLSPPFKPRELLVQSLHVPHTVHVSSTVSLYLSPFKCNIFTETEFSWKLSSSMSALLFDPCFLFCFSFTLGDSFSGNICS